VGTRVSEIRALSDPVKEWFWIPTDCNLADMGTRPSVRPEEMDLESAYQKGMDWMRLPASKWPAKKTLSPPPVEELRKDLIEASALVVRPEVKEEWPKYPVKNVTVQKVKRIYGYVFLAAAKWLKKDSFVPLVKVDGDRGSKYSAPPSEFLHSAERMLIQAAQRTMEISSTTPLMPVQENYKNVLGQEIKTWVIGGRNKKHLKVAYDQDVLPILDNKSLLAKLYLEDAHSKDHGGLDAMVLRSRQAVWVIKARKLAKSIKKSCFTCKLEAKRCESQVMAPLPAHRMGPAPIFHSTAVDLFGPFEFKGTVNQRSTGKGLSLDERETAYQLCASTWRIHC
jgi:hypothetical protein